MSGGPTQRYVGHSPPLRACPEFVEAEMGVHGAALRRRYAFWRQAGEQVVASDLTGWNRSSQTAQSRMRASARSFERTWFLAVQAQRCEQ
jgi:hypothetical protein